MFVFFSSTVEITLTIEQIDGLAEAMALRRDRVERVKIRLKRNLRKVMRGLTCFGKLKYFESLD